MDGLLGVVLPAFDPDLVPECSVDEALGSYRRPELYHLPVANGDQVDALEAIPGSHEDVERGEVFASSTFGEDYPAVALRLDAFLVAAAEVFEVYGCPRLGQGSGEGHQAKDQRPGTSVRHGGRNGSVPGPVCLMVYMTGYATLQASGCSCVAFLLAVCYPCCCPYSGVW